MGFSGNLASMSLADIFQNLAANGQSGTLDVDRAGHHRYIYFEKGMIADAAREHRGDGLKPLAGYFSGRCLLNNDQAEYAMRRCEDTHNNLVLVVPELGYATEEETRTLVSKYVEEEVYDLFTWDVGEFEFTDGAPQENIFGAEASSCGVKLPTGGLVMEAARRIDEWGRIRKALPSGKEVLIAAEYAEEKAESLEPIASRVLGLADGTRDIDDIVTDSYLSRFEVGAILCSFLEDGLLRSAEPGDLEKAAKELIKNRRPDRAVKAFERLIAIGQDSLEIRMRLAETAVLAEDPSRAAIHLGVVAESYVKDDKMDKAVEAWEEIVSLTPGNSIAHQGLAEHYRKRKDKKRALKHYTELCRAHAKLGNMDRAMSVARSGLEINPRAFELRSLLAEALLEAGWKNEAAEEFEKLGDLFLDDHRNRAASEAYRRVLQIDRNRKHAKQQLGGILAAEAEKKRARSRAIVIMTITLIVVGLVAAGGAYEYLIVRPKFVRAEELCRRKLAEAEILFQNKKFDEAISACRTGAEACGAVENLLSFHRYETKARRLREQCDLKIAEVRSEEATLATSIAKRAKKTWSAVDESIRLGEFRKARDKLRELVEFGVDADKAKARKRLELIEKSIAEINGVLVRIGNIVNEDEEFRVVWDLVQKYPNHRDVRKLTVPVKVESEPSGALLALEGGAPSNTPCTVRFKVQGANRLTFSKKGYKTRSVSAEVRDVAAGRTLSAKLDRVYAWQVRLGVAVEAPIVRAGKMLVFGDRGGRVSAVNSRDGKEVWQRRLGALSAVTGAACISEGTVFVTSLDKRLYALDLATGENRWEPVSAERLIRNGARVGTVQLLNNKKFAFFGSEDGGVYCVDAVSGKLRWKSERKGSIEGAVVVTKAAIFVGNIDEKLYALDPVSGKELWTLRIGSPVRTTPALSDDKKTLYLGADDGVLYAVNIVARRVQWRRKLGGSVRSGPILFDGKLFCGSSDGTVHCVRPRDKSADPVWEQKLGGRISADPLVTTSRVYIGCHDKTFYALDRGKDGTPVWSFRTGGRIRSAAAWTDGFVVFGSDDGFIYAFDERP